VFEGEEHIPALQQPVSRFQEPHGWVADLFNRFHWKGGYGALTTLIRNIKEPSVSLLAALMAPFGHVVTYLNADVVNEEMSFVAQTSVEFVKNMTEEEMKGKDADKVFDLVGTLHIICKALWPDKTSIIDDVHLQIILRMLKVQHFNARMYALKELTKIIREVEKQNSNWNDIGLREVILKWLQENKVLSVAMESSLHQSQYCDKLHKIIEFAGAELSLDELTTIWSMQTEKHPTIVDNIHNIIVHATRNFSNTQMNHLVELLRHGLLRAAGKAQDFILLLIGRIGKEKQDEKVVSCLLEVLWNLAHDNSLQLDLLKQALQSHLDILSESSYVRSHTQLHYISEAVEDLKKNNWQYCAIHHMLHNMKAASKPSYSKNTRNILQDLQKQYDLIRLVCSSLMTIRAKLVTKATAKQPITDQLVVNNRFTYGETVHLHLQFIEYIVQEGGLYLSRNRASEIWDCLMEESMNFHWEHETCWQWFLTCINDLNGDTQLDIFTNKMQETDVAKVSEVGFNSFKAYFKSVNSNAKKILKITGTEVVDQQDLIGLPYLWKIILEKHRQSYCRICFPISYRTFV
jgi:ubiquitin carboxyl-terminal hydrolase 9/24